MGGRAVVLGATGFVGRHVVGELIAAGWDVSAAARGRACPWPGLEQIVCDASEPGALLRAVDGADCVVNATASSPTASIRIARNLAALLRHDAVEHVVHLSSLSVFGHGRGVFGESSRPAPSLGHVYARAKWRAEQVLPPAGTLARNCSILRPGCIYGPGAAIWVDRICRLIVGSRLGWLGAGGEGECSLIHVADVAAAVRRVVVLREPGLRHLIAPDASTWNEYFLRLSRLLGVPLRRIGAIEVAASVWLQGPLQKLSALSGGTVTDNITPSMARLFGSRARMVSERPELQDKSDFRPLREGLDEAVQTFLRGTKHRQAVAAERRIPGRVFTT